MNRQLCATPHNVQCWQDIDFKTAEQRVKKLQMRIAKAVKEGKWGKVKSLQWTLTHSFHAKALAVKQVTENHGKRTSGVDHETWETPNAKFNAIARLNRHGYKAQPLRRVYIPKKNGKMRPLSIPTMTDRAMQTLYRFALEPVAEVTADHNSFGFRPGRCVQDALEHCFTNLARETSPMWVLEGDIKGCFDNISHEWILKHIPMDKAILRQFLKSGYVESGQLFPTEFGTPQGGTISTVICNMVLDGIEPMLKLHFPRRWKDGRIYNPKVHFIRYADDFIVTGETPEILTGEVKPLIESFLAKRGLTLSDEKTVVTHIDTGFDFLGCNIRKYNGKLLIRPSKKSTKAFLAKIRGIIRQLKAASQKELIVRLNPIIRGWTNFHRFNVSSEVFSYVDSQIFLALWKWAKRRHRNKGAGWVAKRYFHRINNRNWTFASTYRLEDGNISYVPLNYAADVHITRFPKICSEATPYDERWALYFEERETEKMRLSLKGRRALLHLFNRQRGQCYFCGEHITIATGAKYQELTFGTHFVKCLVHPNCHLNTHSSQLQSAYYGSNRL